MKPRQMKHDGVPPTCFASGGKVLFRILPGNKEFTAAVMVEGKVGRQGQRFLNAKAPLAQSDRQSTSFLP